MSNTIYRQLPIKFNLVAPNSMFSFSLLKREKKKRLENHSFLKKLPHGNILLDSRLSRIEISLNCIKYFLSFTYMQFSFLLTSKLMVELKLNLIPFYTNLFFNICEL